MTSIKPLEINRLAVANGLLNTVATSELLQVAINNSSHLTILDPKLPLLHEISPKSSSKDTNQTLHASSLYSVNSVIPWENLPDAGVGYFFKIIIEDGETAFSFSRISEPQVIHHEWSPVDEATRECFLGVLLNTGELLILQRHTLDAGDYTVVHRLLVFLCDQLLLPSSRLSADGDIVLRASEALFLRVNDFLFGKLANGLVVLNLVHENNHISFYTLGNTLEFFSTQKFDSSPIVRLLWSAETQTFCYLLENNSIYTCNFDGEHHSISHISEIKPPSRFLVSRITAFKGGIIAVDTKSLYVCHAKNIKQSYIDLPYHSTAIGLHILNGEGHDYVVVCYEKCQLLIIKLSDNTIPELLPTLTSWEKFVSHSREHYQNILRRDQTKSISRVFAPYLHDSVDAEVIFHGTSIILDKYMLIAHSSTPKNTIDHSFVSLKSYTISFVPLASLLDYCPSVQSMSSSFASMINTYISSSEVLPIPDSGVLTGVGTDTTDFLNALSTFRDRYFDTNGLNFIEIRDFKTLQEGLILYFRDDPAIFSLQRRYCLNVSFSKTLTTLARNNDTVNVIQSFEEKIHEDQVQIVTDIKKRLAEVILNFSSQLLASSASVIDKFMLASFAGIKGYLLNGSLDELLNVVLTLSTDLCTETFTIGESVDSSFTLIVSQSGHSWRMCDLSHLPVLELTSSTDELERHSYLSSSYSDSEILEALNESINYCIFTGTRKKKIVAGI